MKTKSLTTIKTRYMKFVYTVKYANFFLTTRFHQEQNTPSISRPQDPLGCCREGHSGRLGQRWALFPGMQLSNQVDLNSSKVHLCVHCSKAAFLFFLQTIAYDRGLSSLLLLTFFSSRAFLFCPLCVGAGFLVRCTPYGLIRAPALCDGHLNTNARRRPAQTPTDVTTRALFLPGRGRKRCVVCNAFSSIEGASDVSSATPWEVCLWRELAPLARERYPFKVGTRTTVLTARGLFVLLWG